jgi:predicted ATPase
MLIARKISRLNFKAKVMVITKKNVLYKKTLIKTLALVIKAMVLI